MVTATVAAAGAVGIVRMDEDTRKLVTGSQHLKFNEGETRVVCSLTSQDIVPSYMEILKHLGSKRVQAILAEGATLRPEVMRANNESIKV